MLGKTNVGGGASLNYKVVGGTSAPANPKENTIWVNTTVDKEGRSTVDTTQLSYYIKDTTGVVTKPSSNTTYTRYFECIEGHQYRFQMDDGRTVLIASFTAVPNTGVAGTVLYGTGKTHGADTLDYTVTASSGVKYLGIYYYDSSANSSVPTLTVNDLTLQATLPDETPITSHVFSATQPENPVEGMVWFNVGLSCAAPINALKKNGLWIYPTACQQYINGAWTTRTAETYQGGVWVDWGLLLISGGTIEENISGGLDKKALAYKTEDGASATPTITVNSDNVKISVKASENGWGIVHTVNKIDLTPYKTLKISAEFNNASDYGNYTWRQLIVRSTIAKGWHSGCAAKLTFGEGKGTYSAVDETLDISAVNGEYFIGIGLCSTANKAHTATITKLVLEA